MAHRRLAWTANNPVRAATTRPSFSLVSFVAIFSFILSLSTTVLAESSILLPSAASDSFPACGLSCSLLQQAQSGCVPPKAPENDKSVYVSCFCQSALISQLHNSPDGTCDDTCTSSSDRSLLQTWFNDYCSSGGNIKDDTSGDPVVNTPTTTADSPTDSSTMAASTATSSAAVKANSAPQSWWDGHYQWVIMVIVLIVAFTIIIIVGVWLKRRHAAKHPNLYHSTSGSGNSSGLLFNRAQDPTQLGARSQALAQPPLDYVHTDSVASSSRTEVMASKTRSNQPSRLQKTPESMDNRNVETREVLR
ncbi:hypothetical protein ASPWEDRAFT_25697 [Aspergillus wentii DTO 134E9]|uniref:Integral membrane protein n=1 Tax=Aspergillus wentii DTO 134E9 TaxID=1073089 RepID=A0A1L9RYC4_ASPWE|nr:uncharacterized protein ASPWEDRAFT_25697 [Aspergillus wentii DTO 134E9]KAI9931425.1 hypothetical protein MW887_010000 [Aspergillus wentii]OJJ39905.1 hypothetical protein ASPWEDRAFT_25697 [Aspergillus wentii DTO 134E9]